MGYNSTKKDLFSLDCFGSEKKKKAKSGNEESSNISTKLWVLKIIIKKTKNKTGTQEMSWFPIWNPSMTWTEEPGGLYIVHGVRKSRTWLSDFHFHFPMMSHTQSGRKKRGIEVESYYSGAAPTTWLAGLIRAVVRMEWCFCILAVGPLAFTWVDCDSFCVTTPFHMQSSVCKWAMHVCAKWFHRVQLFVTLWTVAHQAPLWRQNEASWMETYEVREDWTGQPDAQETVLRLWYPPGWPRRSQSTTFGRQVPWATRFRGKFKT